MRTTIPWGDGSGDNIYLDYTAASGSQTVLVSSDANAGYEDRSKDVVFAASGAGSATLTVTQPAGSDFVIITYNDTAITRDDVAVGYQVAKS